MSVHAMTGIKEDARRNCRRTLTMMLNFEVKLVPRRTKVLQIFHVKAGIHTGKTENGKWVQWRRLLIRANMALFLSQSQIRTVGCTAAAATVPTFPPGLPPWQSSLRDPRSLFRVVQKVSARFCELATMLGVNSRNLACTCGQPCTYAKMTTICDRPIEYGVISISLSLYI